MASAGRVLLISKGTWASGTSYSPMDFVYYGGNSYVCTSSVSGSTDPAADTTHWQLMASGFDSDLITQSIVDVSAKVPSSAAVYAEMQNARGNFANIQNSNVATKAYSAGEYLVLNGVLYKVTSSIANGGTITPGTNCSQVSIGTDLTTLSSSVSATEITPTLIPETETSYIDEVHRLYAYKIGGIVAISGAITTKASMPSNTDIFQLPSNCKPVGTIDILAYAGQSHDIYLMYAVNSSRRIRNAGQWAAGTYNFSGVIPVMLI